MADILSIPISATYRIIDGEAVRIAAEYADISADAFARFLMERFGVPAKEVPLQ